MSRDPRDWQADMELCSRLNEWYENEWQAGQDEGSNIIEIYEILPDEPCVFVAECENDLTTDFIMNAREALPYWLQEAKTLKEDNAHWICKHTAAEQKYQTQSNVIADLRKRAENWRIEAESWRTEAFRKYPTPDAYEATCAALEKHRERADKAEEREQKLIKALERVKHYTSEAYARHEAHEVLSTLYPLVREDIPTISQEKLIEYGFAEEDTTNETDPM